MADTALARTTAPVLCPRCGKDLAEEGTGLAPACEACGLLVAWSARFHRWLPLVPPRVSKDEAWKRLTGVSPDGSKARMNEGRLILVPCRQSHIHGGDEMEPIVDLLPSNLPGSSFKTPEGNEGAGGKDSASSEPARRLAAGAEAVDPVLIEGNVRSDQCGFYPVWQFTYSVDYKERAACVDAARGDLLGPARPPGRRQPAVGAAVAGLLVFILARLAAAAVLPSTLAWVASVLAAVASWAAARSVFNALVRKERGR